jgi:hypothetical protein
MDEMRLQDGTCICDVVVQAPAEKLAAAFGKPLKLASNGKPVADESQMESIVFYAGSWAGLAWTHVEPVDNTAEPDDYIVTMLRQAKAALGGTVLTLPLSVDNGLGLAQKIARELQVPALVVWGSDEWSGVGGGAQLDASGRIVRACNVCGPEDIDEVIASRQRMMAGEDDGDDDAEQIDFEGVVLFEPGKPLRTVESDIIPFLDVWCKELGAAQPRAPLSLWGDWEDYAEVWGARLD